jgi:NAD(P)-dependent dehydrogenase (short-subunit alcohol dehydrogenase family)
MGELQGKIAVVTGAAGGIGAATVRAFAREGAEGVVIADLNDSAARAAAESMRGESPCRFEVVQVDVGDPGSIARLFARTAEAFGRLDCLVNCAGICTTSSMEELPVAQWDRVMAVNLRGTFLASREAIRMMRESGGGSIVNVSSISGRIGGIATGMDYCASKGAIITLTMSLAKAAAPHGIVVNAVAPGFIDTEMTKGFTHFDPKSVPLGRIGQPEDVAEVVVFLASARARYVTGEIVNVNGGVYMS